MSTFKSEDHPRGGDPRNAGRFSEASHDEAASLDPLSGYAPVLPDGTSDAWSRVAPVVPQSMYLTGGTALAIHLLHRVSRDLDFFSEEEFDADAHASMLEGHFDDFAVTSLDRGTVNGLLGRTKLQFLDASPQRVLAETTEVAGLRLASVEDILASKIKVIADRGELRDYFDIMCIERDTGLSAVDGLGLFVKKYDPRSPDSAVGHAVRALGYLDDVGEDKGLPVGRDEIVSYWNRRQPQIVRSLS